MTTSAVRLSFAILASLLTGVDRGMLPFTETRAQGLAVLGNALSIVGADAANAPQGRRRPFAIDLEKDRSRLKTRRRRVDGGS